MHSVSDVVNMIAASCMQADAKRLVQITAEMEEMKMNDEMVEIIKRLWNDNGVQECVSRAREYQLNDSAT